MDEIKKEQMHAIKNRLYPKYLESLQSGLSKNKLFEEAQNISGFSLNYQTFSRTIDPMSSTLDIYSIIALCRYWNLDTAYVLSPPNNTETPMPNVHGLVNSSKFSILNDPKYTGTYHGYMYSTKKQLHSIDHFKLIISESSGQFKAEMMLFATTSSDNSYSYEIKKHLTGIPIHAHPNNIFILLTNDLGDFFIISFGYAPYKRKKMYFKQGFMVTSATEITQPILMQRFVLFSKPVSQENMQYIPGLLLLNDKTFHLPVDKMEKLKENNPLIQKFFDEFEYLLNHAQKSTYHIVEAQILNSGTSEFSTNDIIKALTLMKGQSSDANRISIAESNDYAEFSKLL